MQAAGTFSPHAQRHGRHDIQGPASDAGQGWVCRFSRSRAGPGLHLPGSRFPVRGSWRAVFPLPGYSHVAIASAASLQANTTSELFQSLPSGHLNQVLSLSHNMRELLLYFRDCMAHYALSTWPATATNCSSQAANLQWPSVPQMLFAVTGRLWRGGHCLA